MLDAIDVLLLVEDDENDIIITKRRIERSHVYIREMLITRTLQETKDLLKQKSVDVVILDLNLPDSTGLDTVDRVREIYDGVLIVLTSIDDELIGIQAIRKGADEYLVKNQLTERLLTDSVYHAIERHKRWAAVKSAHETLSKIDTIEHNMVK